MRLDGFERIVEEMKTRFEAMRMEFNSLLTAHNTLAARPEAPALEQYRAVLVELEKQGSDLRVVNLKFGELRESVQRTQNKIAAREPRDKAEEKKPMNPAEVPGAIRMDNEIPFQNQETKPQRRAFGRF